MSIGPWQVIIIILAIIILFGGKKLPELARSLGLGLKEFKKATQGIKNELKDTTDEVEQSTTQDDK